MFYKIKIEIPFSEYTIKGLEFLTTHNKERILNNIDFKYNSINENQIEISISGNYLESSTINSMFSIGHHFSSHLFQMISNLIGIIYNRSIDFSTLKSKFNESDFLSFNQNEILEIQSIKKYFHTVLETKNYKIYFEDNQNILVNQNHTFDIMLDNEENIESETYKIIYNESKDFFIYDHHFDEGFYFVKLKCLNNNLLDILNLGFKFGVFTSLKHLKNRNWLQKNNEFRYMYDIFH